MVAVFQVGHEPAVEGVQPRLEGSGVGAIYVESFPFASQQKGDLQIARASIGDASCEHIQQFYVVLVLFLDSVRWWDVDAAYSSFDFLAQPFATIESAFVKQRLSVRVDGVLARAREGAKRVQDDSA